MIEIGTYQNDITDLSILSIENYERIFKIFKSSIDDRDFYVYNILKTIEFPSIDEKYINYHTVDSKISLTILSYKLYGDLKSWWMLYLMNKDVFEGAPFYINGGVKIKYIKDEVRTLIYNDITNSTIYGGKHY